jgi:hypothetical protein
MTRPSDVESYMSRSSVERYQFAANAVPYSCPCGRAFTLPAAFKNHQNSCKTNKEHISAALVKVKAAFAAERLRMDSEAMEATCSSQSIPSDLGSSAMVNTDEVNGSKFHLFLLSGDVSAE